METVSQTIITFKRDWIKVGECVGGIIEANTEEKMRRITTSPLCSVSEETPDSFLVTTYSGTKYRVLLKDWETWSNQ